MKLKGKILSGFGSVILIFTLLGIYTIIRINRMSVSVSGLQNEASLFKEVAQQVENLENESFPVFKKADLLIKNLEKVKGIFMDAIEEGDRDLLEDIAPLADEFSKTIKDMTSRVNESTGRDIKAINDIFFDYLSKGREAAGAFIDGKATDLASAGKISVELNQKITNLYNQKEKDIIIHMQDVRILNKKFEKSLLSATTDINLRIKNLQAVIPIISVFAIIAGIIIALLLTKFAVIMPIHKVIERIKDIAGGEGDLRKRLDVTAQDETGELAKWLNTFIDKLHQVISRVAGITEQVASSAHKLSAIAGESATGTGEQTEQITQVATSMEEMSATVTEIAKNSAGASDSTKEATDVASKGGKVVSRTIEGMVRIERSVRDSADNIKRLERNSEQIGEIISVIDELADQTNLLALNAAIEAARAGEHGRGFAVVADEVRKLAERTTRSTKQIETMIKEIQSNTNSSVTCMETGKKEVEEGVLLINKAGDALQNITSIVEMVTEKVGEIATATEEQSAASIEISRNTESVLGVTKNLASIAEESSVSAKELSRLSDELKMTVGQFKL